MSFGYLNDIPKISNRQVNGYDRWIDQNITIGNVFDDPLKGRTKMKLTTEHLVDSKF